MSAATRDMLVCDTFTLGEEAQTAVVAESIKVVRLAALVRACKVVRLARKRRDAHRHESARTTEREYLRALETAVHAAEQFAGIHDEDEEDDDGRL